MQEAQRETNARFEEYMADSMEAEWAQDKRQLFDAVLPSGSSLHTAGRTLGAFSVGGAQAGPSSGGLPLPCSTPREAAALCACCICSQPASASCLPLVHCSQ